MEIGWTGQGRAVRVSAPPSEPHLERAGSGGPPPCTLHDLMLPRWCIGVVGAVALLGATDVDSVAHDAAARRTGPTPPRPGVAG